MEESSSSGTPRSGIREEADDWRTRFGPDGRRKIVEKMYVILFFCLFGFVFLFNSLSNIRLFVILYLCVCLFSLRLKAHSCEKHLKVKPFLTYVGFGIHAYNWAYILCLNTSFLSYMYLILYGFLLMFVFNVLMLLKLMVASRWYFEWIISQPKICCCNDRLGFLKMPCSDPEAQTRVTKVVEQFEENVFRNARTKVHIFM